MIYVIFFTLCSILYAVKGYGDDFPKWEVFIALLLIGTLIDVVKSLFKNSKR